MSEYWKAILKRAGYTAAEAALALIGTGVYLSDVNWKLVLSASAMAALISVLKSIVMGVPEVAPAEEAKDSDVANEPTEEYPEDDNYDDLAIDDDVDEGDEPEVYDDEVE